MQIIEMNLQTNEAVIKSVDGEISNGNIGSVELQIINAPANWTNAGKVWATFIKNGQQHPKLTTYIASENRFVTLIPSAIFEDDRSFGIFVYYIGNSDYVETRRIIDMPIAETGKVAIDVVPENESSQVMQMLQDMSVLYEAVSGAEENRYLMYYKAEGVTKEELNSEEFTASRMALYGEAEISRDNKYIEAEDNRNSSYAAAEDKREESEETRRKNEEERTKAETKRNQNYAAAEVTRSRNFDDSQKTRQHAFDEAESNRKKQFDEAEANRKSNENQRISNENARKSAEETREANEAKREAALNKILVPGSETIVNRAECDDEGNKIRLTYARKEKLDNLIVFGNVVARAECDDLGNKIRLTYATKKELEASGGGVSKEYVDNAIGDALEGVY